jgi:hypothetical protein
MPDRRQLLRGAEFGGIHRRFVLLHPEGREVPDGSVDVLPHQHRGVGAVRAHADRGRRGRIGGLPRRLYRAAVRAAISCTPPWSSWWRWTMPTSSTRRCRTGTPATRTASAASTTSSPSAACQGREFEDLVDPGGNRLGDHVEVPVGGAARRQLGGRILFGGGDQPPAAGRHRHQDDPHRAGTRAARSSARASRPAGRTTATADWCVGTDRRGRAQSLAVRFDADRRPVRRAHLPVHRGAPTAARVEHEATTSKIGEDQLFYFAQRGISRKRPCR